MARSSEIRKFRIGAVALGFMVAFALAIVASPAASAGTPAFCQQYPNAPECEGAVGPAGGTGNETPDAGNGPTADRDGPTADRDGSGSGGKLPFTGYPLTPLVLLLLALLAAGLLIRSSLAIRDRFAAGRAGTS